MTIIFTGHVAQVVLSGTNLDVHIQTAAEACGRPSWCMSRDRPLTIGCRGVQSLSDYVRV